MSEYRNNTKIISAEQELENFNKQEKLFVKSTLKDFSPEIFMQEIEFFPSEKKKKINLDNIIEALEAVMKEMSS